MPIRNPFKRAPGAAEYVDENGRNSAEFQQTKVTGAKPINTPETTEYKMCEINDSGVYLPPSPPESKHSFFGRSNTSTTTSSNHRSFLSDTEPFNISRESFDSYRRSFDISARSPMPDFDRTRQSLDSRARQSLDSRRAMFQREPRSSLHREAIDRPNAPAEEGFEEVGLNEEPKPKKRGLFGFGDSSKQPPTSPSDSNRPPSSHHGFFSGRKRGQSGQGAELGQMDRTRTTQAAETRE